MSLSSLAVPLIATHTRILCLQNTGLDFNSGYRGGSIKPVSGFGGDNLFVVGLIMLLVPILIGLYYAYKHRDLIRTRLRHMTTGDKGAASGRQLEALREGRQEIEVFTTHKGRERFVGLARLEKVKKDRIELVVMSAANVSKGFRNNLATLYFPPTSGAEKNNCFRAIITSLNSRRLVLGRRCVFSYESRRQHFRVDIGDPKLVKMDLWHTMPPADGVGRFEDLPPMLAVDWHVSAGPQSPRVKDVSLTGLGVLVPMVKSVPDLEIEEPVTIQLKVFNRKSKKYRALWVAALIRNRINISGGKLILGLEFTHRGYFNGDGDGSGWSRIDPDLGMPGLAGVLEGLAGD